MTTVASGRPLDGVKILDMAEEKGELCGRLLADLGAEVVRAEPPGGSVPRRLPPHAPDGTSLFFAHRNASKRGVVIDPGAGDFIMEGPAFHSPSIPGPTGVPAPGLGADTCDICRGVLGMGEDEITELLRTGVLEVDTAALLNTD